MDKKPAIMVRKPDATRQPAPQDIQLMSKHRVLSFKPQLRLEWRGQGGQNETEQPDHSASLGDFITSSTQIRFSVHTALARAVVPNSEQRLRPGLFITGRLTLAAKQVGVAIKSSALQTVENRTVV